MRDLGDGDGGYIFIYFSLDVYNLIKKSINKVIKTIIFLQFKKSQFFFLNAFYISLEFLKKKFFYKNFDIPLT